MNLKNTFAVLKPDLAIETIAVTPAVHQELDTNYDGFKSHVLISAYTFNCDWGMWEKHPAGDETVVLISGTATMVLKKDSGEEIVKLTEPGSFLIVPKNTWHTALISEAAEMLFITPGEGTENKKEI